MSVSLVNLTAYPNAGHLGAGSFAIPATTPGNTLIVLLAWNAGGGGFTGLLDNAGDLFRSAFPGNPNQGVSQPNTGCGVDMWYATNIGVATLITFSSAFNPYIWVLEVTPADFDNNVAFTSSSNLGTPIPVVGPSVTGGIGSFYVAVAATFTNNVLSVNAPWTLEATLNGNGAAHYIGTGTQTPTFTENGSNTDKFNFIAATFSTPLPLGTITVNKTTVPGGSPQSFIARPSWSAPLALTDGASVGSGPLAAGVYAIAEDAVPGWLPHISVNNGDPASAINVANGDSIIVSIINTATSSSPPGGEHFTPKPPLTAGPVQNIPLDNSPNQVWRVTVVVDNKSVTLLVVLRYNETAKYWVATIRDSKNNLLLDSLPFVTGEGISQNLLNQFAYLGIGSATVFNASQVN